MTDFTLPELGENITAGDVLRVLVKPGDTLAKDQPVLELETDKATIEVPSSVAGRSRTSRSRPATRSRSARRSSPSTTAARGARRRRRRPTAAEGAGNACRSRRPRRQQHVEGKRPTPVDKPGVVDAGRRTQPDARRSRRSRGRTRRRRRTQPRRSSTSTAARVRPPDAAPAPETPPAPAAPSVRRMARELGVDIDDVAGSGAGGRISVDDVKAYAQAAGCERRQSAAAARRRAVAAARLPQLGRGRAPADARRPPQDRRASERRLGDDSARHAARLADITALEELRKKYAKQVEAAGGKLTVTAIVVKVVAAALKKFPQFNASIDHRRRARSSTRST